MTVISSIIIMLYGIQSMSVFILIDIFKGVK